MSGIHKAHDIEMLIKHNRKQYIKLYGRRLLFAACALALCVGSGCADGDTASTAAVAESTTGTLSDDVSLSDSASEQAMIDGDDPAEVLSVYGVKEYDDGICKLSAVEGIWYLPLPSRIEIYYQGYYLGWFGCYEMDRQEQAAETAEQLTEIVGQRISGASGGVTTVSLEEKNGCHVWSARLEQGRFSYGNVEFLVEAKVFDTESDALAHIFWTQDMFLLFRLGASNAYVMYIDSTAISEEKIELLYQAVVLKEAAFEEAAAFQTELTEDMLVKSEAEISSLSFSSYSSLKYRWDLGYTTMTAPEGTIGLFAEPREENADSEEGMWYLYSYNGEDPAGIVFVSTEEDSFLEWMRGNDVPEDFLLEVRENTSTEILDYAMEAEIYTQAQSDELQERGIVPEEADRVRTVYITVIRSETGCWYGRIVWIPEPSYSGS